MAESTYKELIRGLGGVSAVVLRGTEFTGAYLAGLVALSGDNEADARVTPQLLAELGRLVAAARADLDRAELAYRRWREAVVTRVTNSVDAAREAGFECACNPGNDSKGKPKEPTTPSVSAAESWVRTLPEYEALSLAQIDAAEVWSTLHAAHAAAGERVWAIRAQGDPRNVETAPGGDVYVPPSYAADEPAGYEPATLPPVPQAPPVVPPPPGVSLGGPPLPPPLPPAFDAGDNTVGMPPARGAGSPPPPPPIPPARSA